MMKESESIESILAEWRECIEAADPSVWNDARIAGLVKTTKAQQLAYLDRLKAAWKRDEERAVEHATRHAEAVARDNCRDCIHNPNGKNCEGGNAAALREALLRCEAISCLPEIREQQCVRDMRNIIAAALSAPTRNCDRRFVSAEEARTAYCSECGRIVSIWDGYESLLFEEWLFAPAAEQKGEGDAM